MLRFVNRESLNSSEQFKERLGFVQFLRTFFQQFRHYHAHARAFFLICNTVYPIQGT